MKVLFPRWRDRAEISAWPFVGIGLACLGILALGASKLPAKWLPPCGFHLATGHPCPSCGVTRMSLLMWGGHVGGAFKANPFFAGLFAVLALWFLVGLAARLVGRDVRISIAPAEGKWMWIALVTGFFVNWAYIWIAGI